MRHIGCVFVRALILLLVLASCRDILSLDDVPPPMPGSEVTGRYRLRALANSADYKPIVTDYPVQAFEANATLEDGSVVPIALAPDGTFAFNTIATDDGYRLRFVTTRGTFEFQHSARHLELVQPGWPLDSQTVDDNTTITYALNDPPPSGAAVPLLRSTGSWTQAQGTQVTPSSYSFDWPRGFPRLREENFDRLFFTFDDNVTSGTTTYRAIVRYRFDDVTLLNGQVNAVSSDLQRVGLMSLQRTRCIRVRADAATMLARLSGVYEGITSQTAAWYVADVADPSLGFFATQALAYATITDNFEGDIDYGDPFPGVNAYLVQTVLTRPLRLGAASLTAYFGTRAYDMPANGGCGTPAPTPPTIALPRSVRIAQTELQNEPTVTIDRSGPIRLDWTIGSQGAVDLWRIALIEVSASLEFGKQINFVSVEPSLLLDPRDLVAGKSYVVQVTAVIGFSGASDGELATRTYPTMSSDMFSSPFTIAN